MSVTLTSTGDYSANPVEWRGPTSVAPVSALFLTDNAVRNLVKNGVQPSFIKGDASTITPGVLGKSLPKLSVDSVKTSINTFVPMTPKFTVIGIFNITPGALSVPLSSNQGTGAPFFVGGSRSGPLMNNYYVGSTGTGTLNVSCKFGAPEILGWSYDASTTVLQERFFNATENVDQSGTATIAAQSGNGGNFNMGFYDPADTGSVAFDFSCLLMWDTILSDADLAAAKAWFSQYAAAYGVAA